MNKPNTDTTCLPRTLAEVVEQLTCNTGLSPVRRRDLVSAVTTTGDLLDHGLDVVETDVPKLRKALASVSPAMRGITSKRFANIKSDLAAALRITGAMAPARKPEVRSAGWNAFLAAADAKHHAWGLARFADFCLGCGIEPAQVTDETIRLFFDRVDRSVLTKDPFAICQETVQRWNKIAYHLEVGEGLAQLSPLRRGRYIAPPLTTYPKSLQDDVALYAARMRCEDLFAEEGPDKPLKAITIRNIEAHLRQYLDALVGTGRQVADLRTLADIVQLAMVRDGLRQLRHRIGRPESPEARNILATLIAIATHHVKLPDDDLKRLRRGLRAGKQAQDQGRESGMTTKNMERLSQFDLPGNLHSLTGLPERLIERAKLRPQSPRSALDAMYATALNILLAFPIRVANLASLDMQRHLSWAQRGTRRTLTIRIEGVEVKNGQPLEVNVREELAKLIWVYVSEFRTKICGANGTALFPWASGEARAASNLGQALSDLVLRETGLRVNPHLFRHLAGKRFLEENPGQYEVVRRFLGHKKIDTTLNFYTRLESKQALAEYDRTVLASAKGRKK